MKKVIGAVKSTLCLLIYLNVSAVYSQQVRTPFQLGCWAGRDLNETHVAITAGLLNKISFVVEVPMSPGYTTLETGDNMYPHPNTGVYKVGTWGNRLTGKTQSYHLEQDQTEMSYGILYSLDEVASLYVAGGSYSRKITHVEQFEAEDITSGFNVLGTYYVYGVGSYMETQRALNVKLGIINTFYTEDFFGGAITVGIVFSYNTIQKANAYGNVGFAFKI